MNSSQAQQTASKQTHIGGRGWKIETAHTTKHSKEDRRKEGTNNNKTMQKEVKETCTCARREEVAE